MPPSLLFLLNPSAYTGSGDECPEEYASITIPAPLDECHDGIPDAWELTQELDVGNPSDVPLGHNGVGYTNLEVYLNSLVPSI
jgi:hypothetical protein